MKARVDDDACTGCGICEDTCPEVFEVIDALAKVKVDPVPGAVQAKCREAMENCPTEAITIED